MDRNALSASKYAPVRSRAGAAAISRAEDFNLSKEARLQQDKGKATRLLSRLKWKAETLLASYIRALEIYQAEIDANGYIDRRGEERYPFVLGMGVKHAESMFKVDFFEFYTLLERYLTLCLSIFDVNVSGMAPKSNVNALRFITNSDYAARRPEANHQFHANLLEALDDPNNPLHKAFGNQDIRIQLGLAKDYRNHWKDADEKLTADQDLKQSETERRKAAKLGELDLQLMLHALLAGCEHALNIVHGRPNNPLENGSTTSDLEVRHHNLEMEMDDSLDYMGDPMELD